MKSNTKNWLKFGFVIGCIAATAFIAKAAQWYQGSVNIPSAITTVTTAQVLSTSGTPFTVPQNVGISLVCTFTAAQSSNTTAVIAGWDVTADGTNWTTNAPIRMTNSMGANGVTALLQLTPAQTAGIYQMRAGLLQDTTSATAVSWTGCFYGYYY